MQNDEIGIDVYDMGSKKSLFMKNLMSMSMEKEDFKKACLEWDFVCMRDKDKDCTPNALCRCTNIPVHRCICSTEITLLFHIVNVFNNNRAEIGSSCISYISPHNEKFLATKNERLKLSLLCYNHRRLGWEDCLNHFIKCHMLDQYTIGMFRNVMDSETLTSNQATFILRIVDRNPVCPHPEIHRNCAQSLRIHSVLKEKKARVMKRNKRRKRNNTWVPNSE
jgi:hypothetical protein